MALLKTIVRKYTPPTCTLEVRGQESLLSKWAGRTILQDLKFKLSFDDPRQPDDKQVSIWGDRVGLEALSATVTQYVQNFLQSRDGSLETNDKEPIVDSLPRQKSSHRGVKDLAATEIKPIAEDAASTKVIPISPIFQNQTLNPYLKPKDLVTHELFLGALQTPESGASIDLSAIQLFDLATALDACSTEMLHLPSLGKERPKIPLWAYGAGAAAAIAAAVGLAPAAMRLAQSSNSTLVVLPPSQQTSGATALDPNSEAAIASGNPASPAPLGSPTPLGTPVPGGLSSPTSSLPLGATPPIGQPIPSVGGAPGAAPPPGAIAPGGMVPPSGSTSANSPIGSFPDRQPGFPTGLGGSRSSVPQNPKPSTQQTRSFDIAAASGSQPTYGISSNLDPAFGRSQSAASSPRSRKNIFLNSANSSSGSTSAKPTPKVTRRSSTPTVLGKGKVDPNVSNTVLTDNSGSGLSGFPDTSIASSQAGNQSPRQNSASKRRKAPVTSARRQTQTQERSPASSESDLAFGIPSVAPSTEFNFSPLPATQTDTSANTSSPDPIEPEFSTNSTAPSPVASPGASSSVRPNPGALPTLSDRDSSSRIAAGSATPSLQPEAKAANVSPPENPSSTIVPAPGDAAALSKPDNSRSFGTSTNLEGANTYIGAATLDSVPASEVKRYFEGQWKPIKGVNESLDYTLEINPNGSINRILPIKEVSRQYIERTGMPKLTDTPMVSPIGGGRSVKVRVVLEPDGTVKTAQEQ